MGMFDWLYKLNLSNQDRVRIDRALTLGEVLVNNKEVEIRISIKDKKKQYGST